MASRKRYLEQEGQEELRAAIEIGSTSSNDILRANNLPTTKSSYEEKKNRQGQVVKTVQVEVRGQDVFSAKTWQEFLASTRHIDADLISLLNDTNTLVGEYSSF